MLPQVHTCSHSFLLNLLLNLCLSSHHLQVATPAQAEQLMSGYHRLVGGDEPSSSSSDSEQGTESSSSSTQGSGTSSSTGGVSNADGGGMGRSYQVMAFCSKGLELGALAGFEGGRVVEGAEKDQVLSRIDKL